MLSSRYIDPTTDFGFKRLFGEEDSKEILKAFLDAILELPHPIRRPDLHSDRATTRQRR